MISMLNEKAVPLSNVYDVPKCFGGKKLPLLLLISINTLSGGAKLVANQTLADSFSFPLQDWRDDPLGLSLSVDLHRGLLYSCSSTEQRPESFL